MLSMYSLIGSAAWSIFTLAGVWKLNAQMTQQIRAELMLETEETLKLGSCLGSGGSFLCIHPPSLALGLAVGSLGACVLLALLYLFFKDRTNLWLMNAIGNRQAVLHGERCICLSVLATHVPQMTRGFDYIKVAVQAHAKGGLLAEEEVALKQKVIALPLDGTRNVSVDAVELTFVLSSVTRWKSCEVGRCSMRLTDLILQHGEDVKEKHLICDRMGNAVLETRRPYWPCELSVSISPQFLPQSWREARPPATLELGRSPSQHLEQKEYPRHIFMMTRGTRGDVQPFVALARGMAEREGWLVTICTEYTWRKFVQDNSAVSRGRIIFRPSGGDTEKRMSGAVEQWAVKQKTEFMQMLMLANSEAEFLPSATVILHQIQEIQRATQPLDLLVFGLTLTGVAMLASEWCRTPVAGFFLQPSCIPSKDSDWKAVEYINATGLSLIEKAEELACTHKTLANVKQFVEHNPFAQWSIDNIRGWFNLPPAKTWKIVRRNKVPIIIPMKEGTFKRPSDWQAGGPPSHLETSDMVNVLMTDFIFLRKAKQGSFLDVLLQGFIDDAHRTRHAKLCLMTVSSMPIKREVLVECVQKMLDADSNLRLIYVGKKEKPAMPERHRVIEVEQADFGLLFKYMDAFIVHGGLGTTVEALRMKKPVCVTGPLLLDQRFWGELCHKKGVGPPPVHIDDFVDHCVNFIDGAFDEADGRGWQKNAREQDWGDVTEDGVQANVACFKTLIEHNEAHGRFFVTTASRYCTWFLRVRSAMKWMFTSGLLFFAVALLTVNVGLMVYYFHFTFNAWLKWLPRF